jgi:DNA/RNA-binding domain of Phe-tRNA-synthetase-like protein
MEISVSEELKSKCPEFRGVAVEAWVTNTAYCKELWEEIGAFTQQLRAESNVDDCKEQYAIAATRTAYRRCGKDPSRYRPSAEALRRRLLRGLELYQIDTLVDIINLVSLQTGFSIGGFDADKIVGDKLVLGIGREGEPYEGIGRGVLNIDGLPVYRDAIGGIGTPTSDHERTKMDINTVHLLAIINGYSGEKGLQEAADFTLDLLNKYAGMTEGKIVFFE